MDRIYSVAGRFLRRFYSSEKIQGVSGEGDHLNKQTGEPDVSIDLKARKRRRRCDSTVSVDSQSQSQDLGSRGKGSGDFTEVDSYPRKPQEVNARRMCLGEGVPIVHTGCQNTVRFEWSEPVVDSSDEYELGSEETTELSVPVVNGEEKIAKSIVRWTEPVASYEDCNVTPPSVDDDNRQFKHRIEHFDTGIDLEENDQTPGIYQFNKLFSKEEQDAIFNNICKCMPHEYYDIGSTENEKGDNIYNDNNDPCDPISSVLWKDPRSFYS